MVAVEIEVKEVFVSATVGRLAHFGTIINPLEMFLMCATVSKDFGSSNSMALAFRSDKPASLRKHIIYLGQT